MILAFIWERYSARFLNFCLNSETFPVRAFLDVVQAIAIFKIVHDDNLYRVSHVHTSVGSFGDLVPCSTSQGSMNDNNVNCVLAFWMWVNWVLALLMLLKESIHFAIHMFTLPTTVVHLHMTHTVAKHIIIFVYMQASNSFELCYADVHKVYKAFTAMPACNTQQPNCMKVGFF